MAWPGDQVQQMVIAKLSLRLSLTNPSNIWHCSKEIYHKSTDREREREREREKKRKRKRKRKRARERAPQVQFPSSVLPVLWMCTTNSICLVYAKFNGLSCMVPGYRFWGALSLYSVSCTSLTEKNPATLKWSSTILTVTHIHIYIYVYIIDMLIWSDVCVLDHTGSIQWSLSDSGSTGSARHPGDPAKWPAAAPDLLRSRRHDPISNHAFALAVRI